MSRLAQSYLTWAGNSVVVKCPIVSGRRRTSNGPYQGGNHAEACDYGVTDQVQSYLRRRLCDAAQKRQHGALGNVEPGNEGNHSGKRGLALVSKKVVSVLRQKDILTPSLDDGQRAQAQCPPLQRPF